MAEVILGDCVEVMRGFAENSVDCIVTDPPYGLGFMGKAWDKALPPKQAFVEMCRVLKPGALAFVMSSPRQDLMWRMAQLLEESGFELGQSFISWVYASGFPKAYDVSKGIDARNNKTPQDFIELGNYIKSKRIELGLNQNEISKYFPSKTGGLTGCVTNWEKGYNVPTKFQWVILKEKLGLDNKFDFIIEGEEAEREKIGDSGSRSPITWFGGDKWDITKPALDEAKQWSGWKAVSGLKPALEVVFMVQKPLSEKTIVDNVLRWGTGAMNVDACRIPLDNGEAVEDFERLTGGFAAKSGVYHNDEKYKLKDYNSTMGGRFPANLLVSDDALNDGKPQNKGHKPSTRGLSSYEGGLQGQVDLEETYFEDQGSFSRYFDLDAWARHHGFLNVPKAGTGEREYGLYGMEKKEGGSLSGSANGTLNKRTNFKAPKRRNIHPTIKPVELMGYLIELGCPLGGVVLDPFVGSGTTCVAAKRLGRKFIGIEIDPDSHRIAVARVAAEPVKLGDFNG